MTLPSAELIRLAFALRTAPDELAYLGSVADEDIRAYRIKVQDELLAAAHNGSTRAAKAARLLPVSVAAKIADRTASPFLTARIADAADESWAIDIGSRLQPSLIAGVVRELSPGRAAAILQGISAEKLTEVVTGLAGAGDWVPLADVIVRLPGDTGAHAVKPLDDMARARIGHLVEADHQDAWKQLVQ